MHLHPTFHILSKNMFTAQSVPKKKQCIFIYLFVTLIKSPKILFKYHIVVRPVSKTFCIEYHMCHNTHKT